MTQSTQVNVAHGLALPSTFRVIATPGERLVVVNGQNISRGYRAVDLDVPAKVTLMLQLNRQTLVYEVEKLEVDRLESGSEITGAILRALRVNELMLHGIEVAIDSHAEDRPFLASLVRGDMTLDTYESAYGDTPPSQLSRDELAARVYAAARAMGHPPLKKVAEVLGVSRSTAIRLVAQARAAGLVR